MVLHVVDPRRGPGETGSGSGWQAPVVQIGQRQQLYGHQDQRQARPGQTEQATGGVAVSQAGGSLEDGDTDDRGSETDNGEGQIPPSGDPAGC